jgi:uncharacterized protein
MISTDCRSGDLATCRALRWILSLADSMVSVAQLVELWIVAPAAGGSNPLAHPTHSRPWLSCTGMNHKLTIRVLAEPLAICQLPQNAQLPEWATASGFWSITRTPAELSIVCAQKGVPQEIRSEPGWKALQVVGPLSFTLTGVLASLAVPLAAAGVSVFSVSTFDTDFILVREPQLESACRALLDAGHQLDRQWL